MTPLAHQILRDLAKPMKNRWNGRLWQHESVPLIDQIGAATCFEVTEVLGAMYALRENNPDVWCPSADLHFLPADKTWIEWEEDGKRQGWLLQFGLMDGPVAERVRGEDDYLLLAIGACQHEPSGFPVGNTWMEMPCRIVWSARQPEPGAMAIQDCSGMVPPQDSQEMFAVLVPVLTHFLALINSPKVIGRQQHAPHRGLAKSLRGRATLRDWTEIRLEVTTPPSNGEDDGRPGEQHLTGQKAVHFCRQHLRVRQGKLERVRAHWRGNPDLGFKGTSYKVKPGRTATDPKNDKGS